MADPKGFIKYRRELPAKRPIDSRIKDFKEIYAAPYPPEKLRQQAARCMDCGVPTCHAGCPLGNRIPDWNDSVYRDQWAKAMDELHATNNFPEFTGRLCPAPCEPACVLAINEPPVTIEAIEKHIIETAFEKGYVHAEPPLERTGKSVAVVGSGPAGLACAQQLNRAGHWVTVFERADRIGGLLRYGIPDFKMDKQVIDRRLELMAGEGIVFKTGVEVGKDVSAGELAAYDATVLCLGATDPIDLDIAGRDLAGIHFAMDFLVQQNRRLMGRVPEAPEIHAEGRHVVVIGGGDTGSDCIGTAHRQGAASVVNFELMPKPPEARRQDSPWPYWPARLNTSTSHEEGGQRQWGISVTEFIGENGRLTHLQTVDVAFESDAAGRRVIREIPGTARRWPADLVLLAVGFKGPEAGSIAGCFGIAFDDQGRFQTGDTYMTKADGVFAAGDARRGQSLIVWAISEGREAARHVDIYLTGQTRLPTKGEGDL